MPHCLPAHDGGDLQRTDLIVRLRAVLWPFAVVSMKTRQKSPALVFVSTINGVIHREQAEIKVTQQTFFSCYARLALSKKVLAVVSPNNSIVWSLLRLVWYGKACGDLVKENQVKPIIDQHTSEFVNSTLIPKKVSISR